MTTRQMPATADEQHGIRPKGYRLPESTRLGKVRLQVADLERSLAFYEKVLGMRVIRRTTESVSLGPDGEDREIVHLRQLRSARAVPKRGLLGLSSRSCCPIAHRSAGSSRISRRSVNTPACRITS